MYRFICTSCGLEFTGKRLGYKFCTKACRLSYYASANKLKEQASCTHCGNTFIKNRPSRKFCSKECRTKNFNLSVGKKNAQYRGKSVENYLEPLARKSMRRHKADHSITAQDLIDIYHAQNGKCAITGLAMTHKTGQGFVNTNVSVDRKDSSIGYVKENVHLVCGIVNLMKHKMSMTELYFWCNKILENK